MMGAAIRPPEAHNLDGSPPSARYCGTQGMVIMKLSIAGVLAMALSIWISGTVAGAQPEAAEPSPLTGALWVSATGLPYRDNLKTENFIQNLRDMPFREAMIQVRTGATAFYESQLVPKPLGISETFDENVVSTGRLINVQDDALPELGLDYDRPSSF